jgi:ectoine hydroxylase
MAASERDPYYSRVDPRCSIGERYDPVCHHGHAEGPLSRDELETYEQRGYLVKHALFDAREVAALLGEAERLARTADRARDDVITEPSGDAVRSLFHLHRGDGLFAGLARDPRLCGVARQVLGSSVYLHQSRINFKPAFEGAPFPWHSDFETWHMEDGMPRMRAISVSLLLTRNTEHNGPLLVIPGSHKHYVRCVGETPEDHFKTSLRNQEIGVPSREALVTLFEEGTIDSVTGPAGSVVFFDCNLMHGSGGNITPLPRHNVFLVYNSSENRLRAPWGGTNPRPEFLAERTVELLPA